MNNDVKVGNTIRVKDLNAKFRIISILPESIVICRTDISKLDILELSKASFFNLMDDDNAVIEDDETSYVIDLSTVSPRILERYEKKKEIFNEIKAEYGPDFVRLAGKEHKAELYEILQKHNMPKSTFWKTCTRYLQSGFNDNVLLDGKVKGVNKGKSYNYTNKRRNCIIGIVIDDEVRANFDEALEDYKSQRQKTLKSAYDKMNKIHYSRTEIKCGVQGLALIPPNERPTIKQFYYYANKKLTREDKKIIKTSQMEYRNNERLLKSDSLFGVSGPGDLVEIDACEADVSLVSSIDNNKAIGRPIVYFMIDVFTRIILAVSVAFDNNSLLGVTNLFLNLADDKRDYCNRYGVDFEDERLWPSNIVPSRLRVDRGAEFKSEEFGRICLALGIEKDIVPGGSGSLKGVIEQSFHQMHADINVHLGRRGSIEKRHGSRHHEEAILTITDFTHMIINFVINHNQKFIETYPLTKDMIEHNISAMPALLWQYGIENCMTPPPIINRDQYLFELMTPIKAKISRKGIEYMGLNYINNDPYLSMRMMETGKKKVNFDIRMDMRNVGAVYYISDNQLVKAPLNDARTGNAEYDGMTMKEYLDYKEHKNAIKANGAIYNQQISVNSYAVNEKIVAVAAQRASGKVTDKKNMRIEREKEKQKVSAENSIDKRLGINIQVEEHTPLPELVEDKKSKPSRIMTPEERAMQYKQALQDYYDEDD